MGPQRALVPQGLEVGPQRVLLPPRVGGGTSERSAPPSPDMEARAMGIDDVIDVRDGVLMT